MYKRLVLSVIMVILIIPPCFANKGVDINVIGTKTAAMVFFNLTPYEITTYSRHDSNQQINNMFFLDNPVAYRHIKYQNFL